MFIVRNEKQPIKWPVTVSVPQDGGGIREYKFTAFFQMLTADQIKEFENEGDEAYIEKILVGWGTDLVDEESTPIPFSDEMRNKLAQMTNVKLGIVNAYWNLIRGVKAKN